MSLYHVVPARDAEDMSEPDWAVVNTESDETVALCDTESLAEAAAAAFTLGTPASPTPGRWMPYFDADGIGIYLRNDDGTCGPQIAKVLIENLESEDLDQAWADAGLIATSPELRDALRLVQALFREFTASGVFDDAAGRISGGPDQINRACDAVGDVLALVGDPGEIVESPARPPGAADPPLLTPGNYSVFVLSDDHTWEQPTYRVTAPMSEHDFRMAAEMACGGFISYSVDEDSDCPEEHVRDLPPPLPRTKENR